MTPTLESLASCFQGLIPAQLFTCSKDGIPNAAYLSHVEYVDATHVALSYQFFNKSKRNILENPKALVLITDPDTGQGYQLRLRYTRSETEGPLFERMALRIEAIASYCGLKGIFKLRAADVYQVLDVQEVPEEVGKRCATAHSTGLPDPVFTLVALQELGVDHERGGDEADTDLRPDVEVVGVDLLDRLDAGTARAHLVGVHQEVPDPLASRGDVDGA